MAKKDIDDEEEDEPIARRSKGKKNKRTKVELKDETRHSVWGIALLVLGLFILLSTFKLAGVAGNFFFSVFSAFFGFGYYLIPILLVIL